jgi:hypothetical protein
VLDILRAIIRVTRIYVVQYLLIVVKGYIDIGEQEHQNDIQKCEKGDRRFMKLAKTYPEHNNPAL